MREKAIRKIRKNKKNLVFYSKVLHEINLQIQNIFNIP